MAAPGVERKEPALVEPGPAGRRVLEPVEPGEVERMPVVRELQQPEVRLEAGEQGSWMRGPDIHRREVARTQVRSIRSLEVRVCQGGDQRDQVVLEAHQGIGMADMPAVGRKLKKWCQVVSRTFMRLRTSCMARKALFHHPVEDGAGPNEGFVHRDQVRYEACQWLNSASLNRITPLF